MSRLDFSLMTKFKPFQFEIVTRTPEWARTFEVDVSEIERQIGYAYGWIMNNPKKAPKKNIMRYLYNWMLIARRKGSLRKRPVENFKDTTVNEDLSIDEMIAIRKHNMGLLNSEKMNKNS